MAEAKRPLTLVVDASSTPLHLGIPSANGWEKLVADPGQAMDGLFRAVGQLFEERDETLNSVDILYYCCGPGSTLGLRLAAAFVKTMIWEAKGRITLFQYNALDLASGIPEEPPEYIQAPFRMGKRFVRSGKPGTVGKKEILAEDKALKDYPNSLHLLGPRHIFAEIPPEKILPYDLSKIRGLEDLSPVSHISEQPVPYSPEPVTFKKWEGFIPAKQ